MFESGGMVKLAISLRISPRGVVYTVPRVIRTTAFFSSVSWEKWEKWEQKTNAFSVLWPSGVFIVLVRKVMRPEEVDLKWGGKAQ